jgi:hypothetical protein
MQTRSKTTAVRPQKASQPDDPEQSKRFLEAARDAGADETEKGAIKRAFKAVVKPPSVAKPKK